MRSPHVQVVVNLDQVRASAEAIRDRARVAVIAVVKADAYGLGAARVADVVAPVVSEFAYFSVAEAREIGRPGLVIGPPDAAAAEFRELRLRPTVSNLADAERYRGLPVAIEVEAGMQRFGCPPEGLDALSAACDVVEYFAHATTLESALRLKAAVAARGKRYHAAASALLDQPAAWFDAVRPGLALYRHALRVAARLHLVRRTEGPAGYSGFDCPLAGVILAGYASGLAPGPVLINGRPQRIIETGMNTAFVTVDPPDRAGDEVVLLDETLNVDVLAAHHRARPHEILCRYAAMGPRCYARGGSAVTSGCPDTSRSSAAAPRGT
jgi:alanine racemase